MRRSRLACPTTGASPTCCQSGQVCQDGDGPCCAPVDPCGPNSCDQIANNCGTLIDCGACSFPDTCGGGNPGTPNECGCIGPATDLQAAVTNAATGATLNLCAGRWLLTGSIGIDKNLTLVGAGAGQTILDGQDTVQVLVIRGVTVTVQDLTITKGRTTRSIDLGAGIYNQGTLTLRGVAVTASTGAYGPGIYNAGTLTLQDGSRVTGNTAEQGGGGIHNDGTLTLRDGSRVTGNTAGFGGGIFNDLGTATLEAGSRVTGNTAGVAGGIDNDRWVTVEAGALLCDNTPANDQCHNVANCPAPASGVCPPEIG